MNTENDMAPQPGVDTSTTQPTMGDVYNYQVEKFKMLYQARYIVRKFGTAAERQVVSRQLKKMNDSIDKLNKPS